MTAPRGRSPLVLRDRAILETLYGTGMRVGELVRLRPDDVDTEDKLVRIVEGKGRKDRNVPLTTAAARAIGAYLTKLARRFSEASPGSSWPSAAGSSIARRWATS